MRTSDADKLNTTNDPLNISVISASSDVRRKAKIIFNNCTWAGQKRKQSQSASGNVRTKTSMEFLHKETIQVRITHTPKTHPII